jgi:tRNA1(Val) A37 N6-methylase TrmN6
MSLTDFPRGLIQPEDSFRFSMDALLLAAFAPGEKVRRAVDLGTGCGVVVFALALRFPNLSCTGIDSAAALIEAARVNAHALGLDDRTDFAEGDVADASLSSRLGRGSYELVTANPPYRITGTGRRISSLMRRKALEAPQGVLVDFIRTAALLLRHHGRFACVFPSARLGDLVAVLRAVRLEPRRLRCVHPRPGAEAGLVLLEARKNAQPDLVIEAPLVLHPSARGQGFSQEALAFCPWLVRCNA